MLHVSPEDCRKTKNQVDKIKNTKRDLLSGYKDGYRWGTMD